MHSLFPSSIDFLNIVDNITNLSLASLLQALLKLLWGTINKLLSSESVNSFDFVAFYFYLIVYFCTFKLIKNESLKI